MTDANVETVVLDSGRKVAVHTLAEGDSGRTVVLCHPAPGAGNFDPDPEQTHKRGVTLIAVDRPGYGRSDPVASDAWATIESAAGDVALVIERLDTGPVGIAGWSAGGRVALALAASRPDLVDRVTILATPAPNEEVPWIPEEHQKGIEQLRGLSPGEVRAALAPQFEQMISAGASSEGALGLLGANPADEAALERPGARERLSAMLEAAFQQGVVGLVDDLASYTLRPWGFAPEAVEAKTLLLYGSADPVAGSRHGSWWQRRLPNARLEVAPGAGHLLVIPMWQRVLSHLAPGATRKG